MSPAPIDAATERLLQDAVERRTSVLTARERIVEGTFAVLSVAAIIAFALLTEPARDLSLPLAAAFVTAYAIVARVEFVLGDGYLIPTQLIVVPMLLLLPTPIVPLLIVLAATAAALLNVARGRTAPGRVILAVNDGTFAFVPAAVLVALDAELPAWEHWPAYVAALAAQFATDTVRESLRATLGARIAPKVVLTEMAHVFRFDALIAPIGLLAAIAAARQPATALLVLPVVVILNVFSREREARIAQTLELGRSYRGTALLLCDLLEDDDEYTGHHTQDVVELSAKVADHMDVSEEVKRETELGAMLHDIGKIHIPDAIINKPGPLDDEEWALMKTHTVEGQRMLDRVGGLLGSVGRVVRASHERYDGCGYPDGLKGDTIPLAARIVAVCDAFNAMTTTRSYREAMPVAAAVEELRRCSGTQFDPQVVVALLAVLQTPGWELTYASSAPYASARNSGSAAKKPVSSSSGIETTTPVT
ncbi:HD-GYP domain-containing protein [Solirubrobacter soli]|uniref:HD-GYP domain-containing protein n=1 Tax=Solirubrobacter soli TaxID=363832 RepID=UPI000415B497|nr:HD-GYP domain-containing protein [Solirubrobacter soli]